MAGHVAQSRDLGAAVVLLATCGTLAIAGRSVVGGLVAFMRDALRGASRDLFSSAALYAGSRAMFEAVGFPLAAAVFSALVINLVQTRGLFSGTVVSPTSGRLMPRVRQLLRPESALSAASALVKTAVLLLVSATAFVVAAPTLLVLCGRPPHLMLDGVFVMSRNLGAVLTFALLGLGLADYVWQLARHSMSLRMSADELKREHRDAEGEPLFKHERRRIHLDLTRTWAHLAETDVVVMDPNRLAVAIRYAPDLAAAPLLVWKGRGTLVSRIESRAVEAGVPIVVNPDLATAVAGTEEGDEIPEWLYERMAELIADAKFTAKLANRAEQPQTTSEVNDAQ